ncbi:MAG: hypothetical protein M9933_09455 [Chitinophagaceae bacterium]|nr:hypothetical protein [Chitinophagaceae bacterium]
MKGKFFVCAVMGIFFITKAQSQISRENIMIGGNISNMNFVLDDGGAFNMTLSPKAAWFIRNNLAVGAYVDFNLMTAKGTDPAINYGVGALGRYYINDPEINVLRKTRFFGEATVGIEGYNPSVGNNTNGLGISAGPGISYFITPNIGLEGLVKYRGIVGFGSSPASNNIVLGIGLQIYLSRSKVENELN